MIAWRRTRLRTSPLTNSAPRPEVVRRGGKSSPDDFNLAPPPAWAQESWRFPGCAAPESVPTLKLHWCRIQAIMRFHVICKWAGITRVLGRDAWELIHAFRVGRNVHFAWWLGWWESMYYMCTLLAFEMCQRRGWVEAGGGDGIRFAWTYVHDWLRYVTVHGCAWLANKRLSCRGLWQIRWRGMEHCWIDAGCGHDGGDLV